MNQLKRLFEPRSVVVIGASRKRGKLGHDVLSNISANFGGKIFAVNNQGGKALGFKLYTSVSELPQVPDLAVIVVPAQVVPQVLAESGAKGIKNCVIISAGFSEIGDAGKKLQADLDRIQKKYRLQILGPNCLGFINTSVNLNASFAATKLQAGSIGFVSQSGAMAVASLDWAERYSLGISKMISIGNKAFITEIEAISYLAEVKSVKVIALYLEQMSDPRRFMKVASAVSKKKPIIVLKAGYTEFGSQAASSHTGSLAQADDIVTAALAQAGVIRARTIDELFSLTRSLSLDSRPIGQRLAIVSNAGGPAIVAADAIAQEKLLLPQFSDKLQKKLRSFLPTAANKHNPIDLLGDADLERFTKTIRLVLKSSEIDALLLLVTPQTMTPIRKLAQWLSKQSTKKPVAVSFLGGALVEKAKREMLIHGLPVFDFPEMAVRYLEALHQRSLPPVPVGKASPAETVRLHLDAWKSLSLLGKKGFHLVEGLKLTKMSQLNRVKKYPIALKALSENIIHKTAAGTVALNLNNRSEAESAWITITAKVRRLSGRPAIDYFFVQPMVSGGEEFFFGCKRDENFGPVIVFGLGGGQVEVIKDVAFGLAPLNRARATQLIEGLRNQQVIERVSKKQLISLLLKVSDFFVNQPSFQEMDLNPVLVNNKGYKIVDARIFIS